MNNRVIVTAPPKRTRPKKPAVALKAPPIVTDHKLRPRVWEEGEEEVQGVLRTVSRAQSPQQIKRDRRLAREAEGTEQSPRFQQQSKRE